MIPPDVASSLRLILPDQQAATNAQTLPVAAAARVADVLSNLVPGQRLMAEIQALLPNGTYRAVVGQRDITLALPFSAKAGDSIELEVQESDGKLTLAFVANRSEGGAAKAAPDSVSTTLTSAGKLIGDLMTGIDGEGKRAPAAPLNGNQALVESMPKNAADLVPVLKQALTQSGMFYEAHQARWVAGQLPTEALRQEPQARFSPLAATPAVNAGFEAKMNDASKAALNGTLASGRLQVDGPGPQATTAFNAAAANNSGLAAGGARASGGLDNSLLVQQKLNLAYNTSPPPLAALAKFAPGLSLMTHAEALPTGVLGLSAQGPGQGLAQAAVQNVGLGALQGLGQGEAAALSSADSKGQAGQVAQGAQGAQGVIAESPPAERKPLATGPEPATANGLKPEAAAASSPGAARGVEASAAPTTGNPVPRELTPLVQQQLDGLANQNFAWQGQVWPGQQMWWEIGENLANAHGQDSAAAQWQTRLKLSLPLLGGIEATVKLRPNGEVGIAISTDSEASQAQLTERASQLRGQFEAAGLNLAKLFIQHAQPAE